MNQYSIMRFGSTFEFVEMRLSREGYRCEWSCMSELDHSNGRNVRYWPEDFDWNGKESGWEMRRKIKAWCVKHDVRDYKIVRNTKYCSNLHGVVYELWTHIRDKVRRAVVKKASEGRRITSDGYRELLCMAIGLADRDKVLEEREGWVLSEICRAGYSRDEDGGGWCLTQKSS